MPDAIHIRPIPVDTALVVRQQVLWPDKTLAQCAVAEDAQGEHLGAYRGEHLQGVLSLFADGPQRLRLRKFAVLAGAQRSGVGSALLAHAIAHARAAGNTQLWCDARLEAVAFYRRFGLVCCGEPRQRDGRRFVAMALAL